MLPVKLQQGIANCIVCLNAPSLSSRAAYSSTRSQKAICRGCTCVCSVKRVSALQTAGPSIMLIRLFCLLTILDRHVAAEHFATTKMWPGNPLPAAKPSFVSKRIFLRLPCPKFFISVEIGLELKAFSQRLQIIEVRKSEFARCC